MLAKAASPILVGLMVPVVPMYLVVSLTRHFLADSASSSMFGSYALAGLVGGMAAGYLAEAYPAAYGLLLGMLQSVVFLAGTLANTVVSPASVMAYGSQDKALLCAVIIAGAILGSLVGHTWRGKSTLPDSGATTEQRTAHQENSSSGIEEQEALN